MRSRRCALAAAAKLEQGVIATRRGFPLSARRAGIEVGARAVPAPALRARGGRAVVPGAGAGRETGILVRRLRHPCRTPRRGGTDGPSRPAFSAAARPGAARRGTDFVHGTSRRSPRSGQALQAGFYWQDRERGRADPVAVALGLGHFSLSEEPKVDGEVPQVPPAGPAGHRNSLFWSAPLTDARSARRRDCCVKPWPCDAAELAARAGRLRGRD